ncbi:acyl-CoA N-acyltransferase, partial [Rickenella mellea]
MEEYPTDRDPNRSVIGLIYFTPSSQDAISPGEVNLGIVLDRDNQRQGFGKQAVLLALSYIFDELQFHRVQVIVMESESRENALKMFTRLGFAHEGTRRRAVIDPLTGVWKDSTHMAMLDTDWALRTTLSLRTAPKTLWDEMFLRHQREREELLRWDDRRMKRSSSMETIR